jgi:hypothetical protein
VSGLLLHVGCGTVYLHGYVNVDLPATRCYLATERPDLVAAYETEELDYYARHGAHDSVRSFAGGPEAAPYVADAFGRWDALPCRDGAAVEVLSRATFEHLSQTEAVRALAEARRVLAPDGQLRLSVPDHAATLAQFVATGDPVWIRCLLGPRNGPGGYHLQSYTVATLRNLVEGAGFTACREERNPHAYPMICLAWRRTP